MPDSSRRAFLRGALLDPEARAAERQRLQPLGPPPPWIAEQVQTADCVRCPAPCIGACPQAIVKRHPSNHALAGIPYLDFSQASCTACARCAESCPQPIDTSFPMPDIGKVALDSTRCHAWNGVVCMSCVLHCDTKALRRGSDFRVIVEAALCTGCGACISPCPADALSISLHS